jgi:hypothetical protein
MADISFQFDTKRAMMNLGHMSRGITDSVRDTLNEMAHIAAMEQRAHLHRVFTLRNKWIVGSIWPKIGMRKGLVPSTARDISRMYSRSGSNSPYLLKQEEGWIKNDPSVPTDEARVGRNHKRVIRKQARMRNLPREKTMSATKTMTHISDPRKRVSVILAVAAAINWKGLILIENDNVLPAGYYTIRRGSLRLVRRNQKGPRVRPPETWHEDAIRNSRLNRNAQRIYDLNAARNLGGFF